MKDNDIHAKHNDAEHDNSADKDNTLRRTRMRVTMVWQGGQQDWDNKEDNKTKMSRQWCWDYDDD